MAILGIVLALIGGAGSALHFTGAAGGLLESIPMPPVGWWALTAIGLALFFLNRRPNN